MQTFLDLGKKAIAYSTMTLGATHKYTLNLVAIFKELNEINTEFPTEDLDVALNQYIKIIDKIAESEGK